MYLLKIYSILSQIKYFIRSIISEFFFSYFTSIEKKCINESEIKIILNVLLSIDVFFIIINEN